MTTTWTTVEERIVWTATEDPSYQFVTLRPTSVTLTGGGGGLELGETSSTAYRGDRGKTAYDHSQSGGNPHGTAAADVGVDASGFNGNLTTSDDTVQEIAQKLDDLAVGGAVAADAIWDAKGDLAIGTGANTAARLAVGAAGRTLTPDSAQTTGLKWAPLVDGNGGKVPGVNSYFSINCTNWNSGTPTAGTLYAMPIRLNEGTLDRIVIELFAGSAGTAYGALYADDGTGWPGAQVVMATISTASSGRIATTVNQPIPAGDYWMVSESSIAISQLVAITPLRRVNSRINDSGEFYSGAVGYALASHSAAPPSTFPTSGTFSVVTSNIPAFFMRYA